GQAALVIPQSAILAPGGRYIESTFRPRLSPKNACIVCIVSIRRVVTNSQFNAASIFSKHNINNTSKRISSVYCRSPCREDFNSLNKSQWNCAEIKYSACTERCRVPG